MDMIEAERAERIVRWRAVMAMVLSMVLTATQAQRMDGGGGLFSWAAWGAIVTGFVIWASGLFQSRTIRLLVNDETSNLHRQRAIAIGFWVMLASAAVCFGLTYVKEYNPRDAVQIIVTTGISAALLSFGVWENAALGRK